MDEEHSIATHVATAVVADEAHRMAEEAKEASQDAQEAAHVALEQSADALAAPVVEAAPVEPATEAPDHLAEISSKLSGISERLDAHESRFATLEKPPEPETKEPEFIEVETEPEKKPEPPKESKPKAEPKKEGETHEQSGKANTSGRRFRRGR